MKRFATANWQGSGKEGKGQLTLQSKVLNNTPYDYVSRFAEGANTNPEELVAAAHAGCFTMKLTFLLGAEGFVPDNLETRCDITLDPAKGEITLSHLTVHAKISGISKERFDALIADAKATCPISKLLNTTITHEATLI
jgi:osmotically inducible protein OsmC